MRLVTVAWCFVCWAAICADNSEASAQNQDAIVNAIASLGMVHSSDGSFLRKWTVPIALQVHVVELQDATPLTKDQKSSVQEIANRLDALLSASMKGSYEGRSTTGTLRTSFLALPEDEFMELSSQIAGDIRYNVTCANIVFNEDSTLTYPPDAGVDPVRTHITDADLVINLSKWNGQAASSWKCLYLGLFGVLGLRGEIADIGIPSIFSRVAPASKPTKFDLDLLSLLYSGQLLPGSGLEAVRQQAQKLSSQ